MSEGQVVALVLAAGRSSRMGGPNKLLATFDGVPLVRRTVENVAASRANGVIVVVGHQGAAVREALTGLPAEIVENADFADGLSKSLQRGFAAAHDAKGVLVVLADQPKLTSRDCDRLIEAFEEGGPDTIVVATDAGEWGNPVILPAHLADAIAALRGDRGARGILAANEALVRTVEIGEAARLDVDTPQALRAAGGVFPADAPPRRS